MKLVKINRKASSFWFIYALAFAFVLAILYIIFGQILAVHLYPVTEDLTGGEVATANKWISFWGFTPYIIVGIILLFLFFKLNQRNTTGE